MGTFADNKRKTITPYDRDKFESLAENISNLFTPFNFGDVEELVRRVKRDAAISVNMPESQQDWLEGKYLLDYLSDWESDLLNEVQEREWDNEEEAKYMRWLCEEGRY